MSDEIAFVDGMELNINDVIRVRAQSVGPGFCSIEFFVQVQENSPGNWRTVTSINLAAPPYQYSEWRELYSSLGGGYIKVTASQNCDTGYFAQLKI